MTFLPSVVRAEYCGAYRIRVVFNDNCEKTVDFREWLDGPIFEPLKDLNYFRSFFLDGGTVAWPNGADIAPETLYEYQRPIKRPGTRLERKAAGRRVPTGRAVQRRRTG